MSLRDELLKAGLISEEKAKKAEVDSRKQAHRTKKDKALAVEESARQAERQRRREQEERRRRERDQTLNQQREAERKRRELLAQVRQLIASHRLNQPEAEMRYNFSADGRFIRSVRVTAEQQKQLARGLLGIAVNDENEYNFSLIPRETALKLASLCPEKLLLLHPENDGSEQDEDWGDY